MKRLFCLKWVSKLLILTAVLVTICGGTVLAATYDTDIDIGLGQTGYWWGAATLEASETVDWLEVENSGQECCVWCETEWDITNYQEDTWIVAQSGDDMYTLWGCTPGISSLTTEGWYWWPGSGYDYDFVVVPHPGQ